MAEDFGAAGMQTVAAASPREALQTLDQEPFDAVVVDHFLPEYSGLELAGLIRKRFAHLPIFMVTGDRDALEPTAAAGIKQIFSKPEDLELLVAVVRASGRGC